MKICILSYPGSVGKTLIASQVIARRMPRAKYFAIESVNQTAAAYGADIEKLVGEKFERLYREMMLLEDAIIDVGASHIVPVFKGLIRFQNAQEEFNMFVIPAIPDLKEQTEALNLARDLNSLGVEASRIKVVCNRVKESVEEEFEWILDNAEDGQYCSVPIQAAIYENELMGLLRKRRMSLDDILADMANHREILRDPEIRTDPKLRELHTDLHVMQGLALTVQANFDRAFQTLFPEVA